MLILQIHGHSGDAETSWAKPFGLAPWPSMVEMKGFRIDELNSCMPPGRVLAACTTIY